MGTLQIDFDAFEVKYLIAAVFLLIASYPVGSLLALVLR